MIGVDLAPCPWCKDTEHLYLRVDPTPNGKREVPVIVCGSCAAQGAAPLASWPIGEASLSEGVVAARVAWNRHLLPRGKPGDGWAN